MIDANIPAQIICDCQDKVTAIAGDMIFISFSDVLMQKRWMKLTAGDEFSDLFLD